MFNYYNSILKSEYLYINKYLNLKMDLYTYIFQNIPAGWEELFKNAQVEIQQISDILEEEKKVHTIVPSQENIFRVFYSCKPQDLTVVITGADPYFQILPNGKPRALGFSFSVSKDDNIPSSLLNIYKEIKNNYPDSVIPKHGDISHWVPQGVFLLNASLTCRSGEPGSHVNKYKLWTPFINKFVKFMATVNKNLIWVLWGKDSQKFEELIDKSFHNIMVSAHPSGLSAMRGFFGCNHFKMINEKLISLKRKPIIWLEQKCSYIKETDIILDIITDKDLSYLQDFYSSFNYMNMDIKYFAISSYIQNLSKHSKVDIKKYFTDFEIIYSKYNTLQNTIDCLNKFYNTDKMSKIMYRIDITELKNLEMFYQNYFKKEYGLCLADFSLISAIKSIYEHRYKHKSFDEYIDTILAKEIFSLKI
jgi:uracil-DNA glycosylase